MSAIVHFNSLVHRSNRKDGKRRDTLVFRRTRSASAVLAKEIRFTDASGRFVYSPDNPLKCGAVAWVEFDSGEIVPVQSNNPGERPCLIEPISRRVQATLTPEASESCRYRRPSGSSSGTGSAGTCRRKTTRVA